MEETIELTLGYKIREKVLGSAAVKEAKKELEMSRAGGSVCST